MWLRKDPVKLRKFTDVCIVRGKLVDKFVPPIIQTSVNFRDFEELFCVFTHVASIYANLLEQKKGFT